MKLKNLFILFFVVVALAFSVAPVHAQAADPVVVSEPLSLQSTLLGIGVFLSFIALLVLVYLQHRMMGGVVEQMTIVVQEFTNNNKALDLLEPLAMNVVPVSLITQFFKGADFLKTLTPDNVDKFIDAVKELVGKATDGQPNNLSPSGDQAEVRANG